MASKCTINSHVCKSDGDLICCIGTYQDLRHLKLAFDYVCSSAQSVRDEFGRNILHVVASVGSIKNMHWLLNKTKVDLNGKDLESGWTALHRACYYGNIGSALLLIKSGASLNVKDHEGHTAMDLINLDRPAFTEYAPLSEVYTAGTNQNSTLGQLTMERIQAHKPVDMFHTNCIHIDQAHVGTFHSAFVSNDQRLFVCGFGQDGRLGLGDDVKFQLEPCEVKSLSCHDDLRVLQVALGRDHTLVATSSQSLYSWGSNRDCQLAQPGSDIVNTPTLINPKLLRMTPLPNVAAGSYHSIAYSTTKIFAFGRNNGQLGLRREAGSTIREPQEVACVPLVRDASIRHLVTCDAATVCATHLGDVFCMYNYECKKLPTTFRDSDLKSLSICCGAKGAPHSDFSPLDFTLYILTHDGFVYCWRPAYSNSYHRVLFEVQKCLKVIALEAFAPPSLPSTPTSSASPTGAPGGFFLCTHLGEGFHAKFLISREEATLSAKKYVSSVVDRYSVRRVPHIHRASAISCDHTGTNSAFIQAEPRICLIDVPFILPSNFSKEMSRSLAQDRADENLHDFTIKALGYSFTAHKAICASRCPAWRHLLLHLDMLSTCQGDVANVIEVEEGYVVWYVLQYLYTDTCDLLELDVIPGHLFTSPHEKCREKPVVEPQKQWRRQADTFEFNPVVSARSLAACLGLRDLERRLGNVLAEWDCDDECWYLDVTKKCGIHLSFNRISCLDFADCLLRSSIDGTEIKVHKCILIARVDYFKHMLLATSQWIESSNSTGTLDVDSTGLVLASVVAFIYTDETPLLKACLSVDTLCEALIVADHLLIPHLVKMCEVWLSQLITLSNVNKLLQFSSLYNASQLRGTCLQFVCLNLPALVELHGGLTDLVGCDGVLNDLNLMYRSLIGSSIKYRTISPIPLPDWLEEVYQQKCLINPDAEDSESDLQSDNITGVVQKSARTRRRQRASSRGNFPDYLSDEGSGRSSSASDFDDNVADQSGTISLFTDEVSIEKQLSSDFNAIELEEAISRNSFDQVDARPNLSDQETCPRALPTQSPNVPWTSGSSWPSPSAHAGGPVERDLREIMMEEERKFQMEKSSVVDSPNFKVPVRAKTSQTKKKRTSSSSMDYSFVGEVSSTQQQSQSPGLLGSSQPPWPSHTSNQEVWRSPMGANDKVWRSSPGSSDKVWRSSLGSSDNVWRSSPGSSDKVGKVQECPTSSQQAASSQQASPGPVFQSAWKRSQTLDSSQGVPFNSIQQDVESRPSFEAILKEEAAALEERQRLVEKPLYVIQMEEAAMTELLEYYESDNISDWEYYSVERLATTTSQPIWKTTP